MESLDDLYYTNALASELIQADLVEYQNHLSNILRDSESQLERLLDVEFCERQIQRNRTYLAEAEARAERLRQADLRSSRLQSSSGFDQPYAMLDELPPEALVQLTVGMTEQLITRREANQLAFQRFQELLIAAIHQIGPMPYALMETLLFPRLLASIGADEQLLQHEDISYVPGTELYCSLWANSLNFCGQFCEICRLAVWEGPEYWAAAMADRPVRHEECCIWLNDSDNDYLHNDWHYRHNEEWRQSIVFELTNWVYCPVSPATPPP